MSEPTHRIDFAALRAEDGDAYVGARIEALIASVTGRPFTAALLYRAEGIAEHLKHVLLVARNDELRAGPEQTPAYIELDRQLLEVRRYLAEIDVLDSGRPAVIDGTIEAGVFMPEDQRDWPSLHIIDRHAAIAPAHFARPITERG